MLSSSQKTATNFFFVSASLLSGATHGGTTVLSERDFFYWRRQFLDYLCKQVFLFLLETPITQAPFPRKSFF
jgi:hypothetical protein